MFGLVQLGHGTNVPGRWVDHGTPLWANTVLAVAMGVFRVGFEELQWLPWHAVTNPLQFEFGVPLLLASGNIAFQM